ncbi:MAG: hypothetical protein Kow0022_10280 [Phycisphaerales bacterium]
MVRELHENDGRFCLKCGYNLADSPDAGHCPECGVEYEIEAVRNSWRPILACDQQPLWSLPWTRRKTSTEGTETSQSWETHP